MKPTENQYIGRWNPAFFGFSRRSNAWASKCLQEILKDHDSFSFFYLQKIANAVILASAISNISTPPKKPVSGLGFQQGYLYKAKLSLAYAFCLIIGDATRLQYCFADTP